MKKIILAIALIATSALANASETNNEINECQKFAVEYYPQVLAVTKALSAGSDEWAEEQAVLHLQARAAERYPNVSWADCSEKLIKKQLDAVLNKK